MQSKVFSQNKTLNLRGRLLDLSTPRVMAILNVTPDSFFDGSRFSNEKAILQHVEKITREGATIIDIGGYSTRPGAADIPVKEELDRVVAPIRSILKNYPDAIISIDTFRSTVAKAAVEAGALLVNDVSGGEADDTMFDVVSSLGVPYVLMHMRGTPQTMTQQTVYENLMKEIMDYFHKKINTLHSKGVKDIIVDPGFGFAKTPAQSFELLQHLDHFKFLEKPILAGLSRKSMIWKTLSLNPEDALNGTTALNTIALVKGASLLRVHDVKEAMEIVKLIKNLTQSASTTR
jgi:dihydropteroate synthase